MDPNGPRDPGDHRAARRRRAPAPPRPPLEPPMSGPPAGWGAPLPPGGDEPPSLEPQYSASDPRYGPPATAADPQLAGQVDLPGQDERTLELREEQLVAQKEMRQVGEVAIRTQVEEVPGRLEVDVQREEVEVEHVPMNQVVQEREAPWEENGTLVVPVYEEQLVVVKRLVLREQLRVRRVGTTERRLYEDVLRRERVVIDDPTHSGLVHERYPTANVANEGQEAPASGQRQDEGNLLGNLARKVLG